MRDVPAALRSRGNELPRAMPAKEGALAELRTSLTRAPASERGSIRVKFDALSKVIAKDEAARARAPPRARAPAG